MQQLVGPEFPRLPQNLYDKKIGRKFFNDQKSRQVRPVNLPFTVFFLTVYLGKRRQIWLAPITLLSPLLLLNI